MKYLRRSFSVAMFGAAVDWPFQRKLLGPIELALCPACGAVDRPGETHIAAGHTDRPRKKVCFGLKDSQ